MHSFLKKRGFLIAVVVGVALCVLSVGTFAWLTVMQNLTNEFTYVPYAVKLTKVSAADRELPLAGAVFGLYDGATDTLLSKHFTDSKGEIVLPQLDEDKSYYFKELNAPYGFQLPVGDGKIPFTPGMADLTVENTPKPSDLTIVKRIGSKTLDGQDYTATEEDKRFPFAFTVTIAGAQDMAYSYRISGPEGAAFDPGGYPYTYADGEQVSQAGTGAIKSGEVLYLRHGERAVIQGIPAGTAYRVVEKNYLVYDDPDFSEALPETGPTDESFGCTDPTKPGHDRVLTTASGWAGAGWNTTGQPRENQGESVAVFENQKVLENYQITMSSLVVVDRILAHPEDVDYEKGFQVTVNVGSDEEQRAYWYEVVHLEDTAEALPDYALDYDYYDRNDPGVPNQQKPQPDTPPDRDHFFGNSLAPPAHDQTGDDETASGLKPLPEIPEVLDPETRQGGQTLRSRLALPKIPESYAADLPLHRPVEAERWQQKDGTYGKLLLSSDEADNPKGDSNTIVVDLHHASAVIIYGIPVGTPYNAWQVDYRFIDGYLIDSTNKDTGTIAPDLEVVEDSDTGDKKLLRTRADIYNYFVLPIMREMTVSKHWEHGENPPEFRPVSTKIDVYDPNSMLVYDSRSYRSVDDWASFEVPKYDEDGKLIDYAIREDMPPDYVITDVEQTEDGFTITNTYAPGQVRPMVQKLVTGRSPPEETFTFSIQTLEGNAPLPQSLTTTVQGEGIGYFDRLVFDKPGTYRYEIREQPGSTKGYTYDDTTYLMTVTAVENDKGVITATAVYEKQDGTAASPLVFHNTYEKPLVGNLIVTKTVQGAGDPNQRFQFTVTYGDKTERFWLSHGKSQVFTDIPVGTPYSVREADYFAEGYTTSSSHASGIIPEDTVTASFTNTKDAQPGIGKLIVRKQVTGSGAQKDRLFRFVLEIDGKPQPPFYLKDGQEQAFGPFSAGTRYRVTEDDYTKEGYITTQTGDSGHIRPETVVAVFTNTRQADDRGQLTVTKALAGVEADRQQRFSFTAHVDGKTYTFTLAGGESHTLRDLPLNVPYWVQEENYFDAGYVTSSSGSAGTIVAGGNHAVFTNRKELPPPPGTVGKLTLTKAVTGSFIDATQRFRFTVVLADQVHEVFLRHGESREFADIPAGTAYAVYEDNYAPKGYTTSSTGASGTVAAAPVTAAFTNHYDSEIPPSPGAEAVQISGKKTWVHGANSPADYPDSITVYVMSGSSIVAQKTVTAHQDWRYAFNLPKYDADGAEITYSVSEETVKSYVKTITGYDILNTYTTGSPDTGDNSRMWVWFLLLAIGAAGLRLSVFHQSNRRKGT